MSTAPSSNKYYIKSLEEEIGLFDRKLAHLHKFEIFPSDAERDIAAAKLTAKRDRLVRTIRDLTEDVPAPAAPAKKTKSPARPKSSTRSRGAKSAAPLAKSKSEPAAPVAEVPVQPDSVASTPRIASPFAGTSLDSELALRNYLLSRTKSHSA